MNGPSGTKGAPTTMASTTGIAVRLTIDSQMAQLEGTLAALEETAQRLFDGLGSAGLLYCSNPEKMVEPMPGQPQAGLLERIDSISRRLGELNDRAYDINNRLIID